MNFVDDSVGYNKQKIWKKEEAYSPSFLSREVKDQQETEGISSLLFQLFYFFMPTWL